MRNIREDEGAACIFIAGIGTIYACVTYLVCTYSGFKAGFWTAVFGCLLVWVCGRMAEREIEE